MSSSAKQYLRLMHFPLPLCVLSFATLGALLAPAVHFDRLAWTYVIVFGSLCLSSYSFDELKGRPLRTTIPEGQLRTLGSIGMGVSLLGGGYLASTVSLLLLAWIPPTAFTVLAYNLELFKGRFHNSTVFALGWGGLPTIGSYFLQTLSLSVSVLLAALATMAFSWAIWSLNHEFRRDLNTVKDMTSTLNGDFAGARRQARRRIWGITKILCYTVALFTVAFAYYRFFP